MTKAEKIKQELEALNVNGVILPEAVVQWAKEHPDSELYKHLEWDNDKAAEQWRLWQVRRLIAIYVVDDSGERKMISLSIDRSKGGGYRSIDDVSKEHDLMSVAIKDALAELRRTRAKYQHLKELSDVWETIDRHNKEQNQRPAA